MATLILRLFSFLYFLIIDEAKLLSCYTQKVNHRLNTVNEKLKFKLIQSITINLFRENEKP